MFQLKVSQGALTEVGPWAVVVAEGLEIFWAFRKGEGCLGGTRPDRAAIECGWTGGGPISMEGKSWGGGAKEGRRGGVSELWLRG